MYVDDKLSGLKLDQCWDVHTHIIGIGDTNVGVYVPKHTGLSGAMQTVRTKVFKHYTVDPGATSIDVGYMDRFDKLVQNAFPGLQALAFGFAPYHSDDGIPQYQLSDFVVENIWAYNVTKRYNSFQYVPSIHPYNEHAISYLEEAKKQGCVAIKWLTCAHNIHPADKRCIPFYEKLIELDIPLITHAGSEKAVQGKHFDESLGNPLHLRTPLDMGVKVIVAHCATAGNDFDFEVHHKQVPSFTLFARLMEEKRYADNLFADVSATTLIANAKWLHVLLQRKDWHHRLLNGSDYPLPALPVITNLRWLQYHVLLTNQQVKELAKIKTNPVLYDFILKRSLSYNGNTFANCVFETKRFFV